MMQALSSPVLLFAPRGYGDGEAVAALAGAPPVDSPHSLRLLHLASARISHASSRLLVPHDRLSLLPSDLNALALALQGNEEISSHSGSQLPGAAVEADPGGLLQQVSSPVAEVVKIFSSSPMQGSRLGEFVLVSVGLIVLFWMSNYIVPDMIFRKLFPQDEDKNQNSSGKNLESMIDGTDGSSSVLATNSKASKIAGTSSRRPQEVASKSDRSLGFGNSTKQSGKSRKGKF